MTRLLGLSGKASPGQGLSFEMHFGAERSLPGFLPVDKIAYRLPATGGWPLPWPLAAGAGALLVVAGLAVRRLVVRTW